MYRSVRAFVRDGRHCRLLAVPAALYAVNNYLKFVMQLFFRPTSAKMIGNLKVLTIALLMRSLMGRSFSVLQWEALFLLVAGISVNQLSDCSRGDADAAQYSLPALLATLGTVTVPSAASVYNEMALKGDMDTSVHLQVCPLCPPAPATPLLWSSQPIRPWHTSSSALPAHMPQAHLLRTVVVGD